MNELIDAILKYYREGLGADVTSLRDKLIGGMHAHLAPHDARNLYGVVTVDTPEVASYVMSTTTSIYGDSVVEFSLFTTVKGPDGKAQVNDAISSLQAAYQDYLFDDDANFYLPTQRVFYARRDRTIVFPDPDGGWTGVVMFKYMYGDKEVTA